MVVGSYLRGELSQAGRRQIISQVSWAPNGNPCGVGVWGNLFSGHLCEIALHQLEARPSRKTEYPDDLTEREVEILRLVAAGRTDREIAGELFMSISTARNHVLNILNKTDSANRTQAASYANRHNQV